MKARTADGGLVTQPMVDSQPKSSGGSYEGTRDPEFNRLGAMLEQQGLVSRSFVGNAAVRRFAMRDPFDHVEVEAAGDFNLFRTAEGQAGTLTPLDFGHCLMSPPFTDGVGRPTRVQLCVRGPGLPVLPRASLNLDVARPRPDRPGDRARPPRRHAGRPGEAVRPYTANSPTDCSAGSPATCCLRLTAIVAGRFVVADAWTILLTLSSGVVADLVTSLMTPRTPADRLDRFFLLLRTPVRAGERVAAPCTLPDDPEPPVPRRFSRGDIGLPRPSTRDVVGFVVACGFVALIAMLPDLLTALA